MPFHREKYQPGKRENFTGIYRSALIQAPTSDGKSYIFLGRADGTYGIAAQSWSGTHLGLNWGVDKVNLYINDFNGDGRADIIIESKTDGGTSAILNSDSQGQFLAVEYTWIQQYQTAPSPSAVTTTAVGALEGTFAVSPSGAATYSISIKVPPSVNDAQPDISLVYNSQAGNGVAGVGWSIGGVSSITRCGATIDRDGFKSGVNLNWDDRYCFQGQRLYVVSGAYGGDHTEYLTDVQNFSRIVSYGSQGNGPAYFAMWTKSGQYLEFGNGAGSQQYAQGNGTALNWSVSMIRDRSGNYSSYFYDNDGDGGHRISHIDYASNNGAFVGGTSRSVTFIYEQRSDVETAYFGGGVVKANRRLTNVQTFLGSTPVRDYRVGYEQSSATLRSRARSVQECAFDGAWTCTPVSDFVYQDGGASWNTSSWAGSSPATPIGKQCLTGDLNGDGKTDMWCYTQSTTGWHVTLSSGSGWGTSEIWYGPWADPERCMTGDLDGDGKTDMWCYTGANGEWHVVKSTGTSWTGAIWAGPAIGDTGTAAARDCFSGDLNGDGRTDMWCYTRSNGVWNIYKSEGNSWSSSSWAGPAPDTNSAIPVYYQCVVGDLNGDARTDMWCYTGTNNEWHVLISAGSGWVGSIWAGAKIDPLSAKQSVGSRCFTGDINGDGKTDMWCYTDSGNQWHVLQSTGTSWTGGYWAGPISGTPLGTRCQIGDINGDHKTDMWCYTGANGDWHVAISDGTSWASQSFWSGLSPGDPDKHPVGENCYTGDLNGDGKADMSCYSGSGGAWNVALASDPFPDVLTTITPRFGTKYVVTQKSLGVVYPARTIITCGRPVAGTAGKCWTTTFPAPPPLYTKDDDAVYPVQDSQPALQVVSAYSASDGNGFSVSTGYRYFGKKTDLTGRGNLGFRQILMSAPSGLVTTTTNAQNFPFIGLPLSTVTTTAGGAKLSQIDNVYKADSAAGWNVPYRYSSMKTTWDLIDSNSIVASETSINTDVDAYGNVGTVTSTASDGFRRITKKTFYPVDLTNWQLDKLFSVATESTVPGSFSDSGAAQSQTRQSVYTYYPLGLIEKEIIQPETITTSNRTYTTGPLSLTTKYTYDTYGNRATTTVSGPDISTRTTTMTYDPVLSNDDGRSVFTTTTSMPVTVLKKNLNSGVDEKVVVTHTEVKKTDARTGVPTSLKDANNRMTRWFNDGFGRLVSEYRADGTSTHTILTDCGSGCGVGLQAASASYYATTSQKSAANVAMGVPVITYFDSLNREMLSATTGFDGNTIYKDTHYDTLRRLYVVSNNYSALDKRRFTVYDYDVLNRVKSIQGTDGAITTTAYSNLTTTITAPTSNDGLVRTRVEKVTSQGQLDNVTDALGNTISYKYDAFGNLSKVTTTGTDTKSSTTKMTHNIRGYKTILDDPDTGVQNYSYNVLGELTYQKDAKNQETWMYYDEKGRMFKRTELEGTSVWRYDTAPNAIGMLASVTGPNGAGTGYTRGYIYDDVGRPVIESTVIDGEAYYMATGFDQTTGQVRSKTYPNAGGNNLTVYNNYDARGFLDKVSSGANGTGTVFWQAKARAFY